MSIKLRNLKGTRDYMLLEQTVRQEIMDKLRDVFERYAYQPLDTPALCYFDVLASKYSGGAEILKEAYKLSDQGGRELGLRYDLTVPFARVIGMNPEIRMPFKKYEIGKVYRDGPVKTGRCREFIQCDVDMVAVKKDFFYIYRILYSKYLYIFHLGIKSYVQDVENTSVRMHCYYAVECLNKGEVSMKLPFFRKKADTENENEVKSESKAESKAENDRIAEVFFRQLNEKRKEDPLIGAKVGAKEIFNRLLSSMKDPRGVHIETLMCALGALAGYSCQASLRKEFIEIKGLSENQVFIIIDTKNGDKYYFGDQINKPLAESQYSVWSLAAGAVQHMGKNIDFELREIFEHVVSTVGSENYGVPRIPQGHQPADTPRNFVKALWPALLPEVEKFCASPGEWPILFGLAIQEGLRLGKDAIDPSLALKIVMESAIPMAKAHLVFD